MGAFKANFRTYLLAFVCLIVLVVGNAAVGKIIYVDADAAAGVSNGSSWVDAYNYLQDALTDAASAEKPEEIRVAHGI